MQAAKLTMTVFGCAAVGWAYDRESTFCRSRPVPPSNTIPPATRTYRLPGTHERSEVRTSHVVDSLEQFMGLTRPLGTQKVTFRYTLAMPKALPVGRELGWTCGRSISCCPCSARPQHNELLWACQGDTEYHHRAMVVKHTHD